VTGISIQFNAFVGERQQPLLRFATVLSGDPQLAEELVADALARAWEKWSRIGAMDYPSAYVRKIIVNEFLAWRRRMLRVRPTAELVDYADESGDFASESAERSALVEQLDTLPRKQRATLVLRFYEGLPDDEIAELLGCSPVTVRSNISRALATLRIRTAETTVAAGRAQRASRPLASEVRPNRPDEHAPYRRPVDTVLKGDS